LSYKDRSQVIDETIIRPEVVLKYSYHAQDKPENEYFPRLRLQTGDTYITDDEGGKSAVSWFFDNLIARAVTQRKLLE